MKFIVRVFSLAVLLAAACAAQRWEIGGNGGSSFLNNIPVTGGVGSATAGFQSGAVYGGFIGHNTYAHMSGEFHYNYLSSNLSLTSGGAEATFKGFSHAIHYDLIFHSGGKRSKVQAFVAVGGGVKVFQGTGREQSYQPLSQFGYFTKARAFKPMGSVGGGLKFNLSRNVFLRTEVRDYITAFPTELITPAAGMKYRSFLQDIVPMVGLSVVF